MKATFLDCVSDQCGRWIEAFRQFELDIDMNREPFAQGDIARLVHGYEICIVNHTKFPPELLAACRTVKHFVYCGTGIGSILDTQVAARLGITVHTVRNYGDTTIAEHTVGLIFAAARQIAQQHEIMRQGGWNKLQGIELRGRRVGIVGYGGVGREVARICAGIGLEVVVWNRTSILEPGVRSLPLEELLTSSDILSLHLALNDETRLFLNRARLSALKPGVIVVNTGRGGLIDEVALVDALRSGTVRHAALDVFQAEPLPADHPLRTAPNLTLTPHSAYWTDTASANLMSQVLTIIKTLQHGPSAFT